MERTVATKLNKFFGISVPTRFKKGDMIIRAQDPLFSIFYIKEGYVRQFVYSENGDDVTINIFKPKSFFPIVSALAGAQNSFNFQAMTEVVAYRKSPDEVIKFLKKEHDVLFDLTKRLSSGLLGLALRIGASPFEPAYKKLSLILLYFAKHFGEQHPDKTDGKIIIKIPLTHGEVGGWIGVARETASRQFEKLSKKGVITYTHTKITVNDITALEKETK